MLWSHRLSPLSCGEPSLLVSQSLSTGDRQIGTVSWPVLCGVKKPLHFIHSTSKLLHSAEAVDDLGHVSVFRDRWDFQNLRDRELFGAVIGVFVEHGAKDRSCGASVLPKES